MDLEFNVRITEKDLTHLKRGSEVVIVGKEILGDKEYLKVIDVDNNKICLVGGLMLDEAAYLVEEEDLIPSNIYSIFDIPKKYLTVDIINNVQMLNT